MPISTRTIQDTINFCKRLSFNRNPVIGNSLEPALTAANIVQQVILSPPFEFWWNTQEIVFTCNPTPQSATSTSSVIAGGVLTVTATNTFAANNIVMASGFTGSLAALNGNVFTISAATGTSFTAPTSFGDLGPDTSGGVFTNITTQDYTIPAPAFSHIEHASVLDLSGTTAPYTPNKWFELTVKNNLSLETSANRPEFISPEVEDGNGNMTFRVASAPNKPYPISVHVQLASPGITSINQTWAPLPDFMQYIYEWGFMALIWQFADDPQRAEYAENKFKAALLGRAQGLTAEQKNIFLNNWEALTENPQMVQQGISARQQ